MRYFD